MIAGLLAALAPIIKPILEALLPLIWEALHAPNIAKDSVPDTDLADRLRERLRADGVLR